MKEVPITNGMVAMVDDSDYDLVKGYKWRPLWSHKDVGPVYAICSVKMRGRDLIMHRLIMGAAPGQHIDHKDGNGLNNTRANLRFANESMNAANRKMDRRNKSGHRGVYLKSNGRYEAKIRRNGKNYCLGTYDTVTEAAIAYNKRATAFFGEFARLNKV